MNKTDFNLFPTQLTHYRWFLNVDELTQLKEHCLSAPLGPHNMLTDGGVCSSGSERPLEHNDSILKEFPNIEEKLIKVLNDYTKRVGIGSLRLTNSWCNIQQEGSITKQHNHPFSLVSAAMFINCPEGSNNLYFENPNPHVEFNYRLDEKNNPRSEGMHEYWYFEPMDGDLIIFPSWLRHGSMYQPNKSSNRIVISVNAVR